MSVKAVYLSSGIVIGEAEEQVDGGVKMYNPVLAIPQPQNMALVPFLGLMEEREIVIKADQMLYGGLFTPAVDLRNHYNKMFGNGIIEAGSNVINL